MTSVILTGFMGTGKTSVGECLAARLGVPFVDTDRLVEAEAGRSVAAIFAEAGEAAFRAAERRAIHAALAVPKAVIATGGGAIVDAANLALLRAAAPLVCLTARPAVIMSRTRAAGPTRPLLEADDREARIAALLAERAAAYAQADLTVDTSDRSPAELAEALIEMLRARQRHEEIR